MAGIVIALAGVAGCGGQDGGGQGGKQADASPPPGGWPQPEGGRITDRMCGLLTDADYLKYGHRRLPGDNPPTVNATLNSVSCLGTAGDNLSLTLHPTAEAAKIDFSSRLRRHKDTRQTQQLQTVLVPNVVQGADESWFDFETNETGDSQFKQYEVDLRRGALLVSIELSGIKGKQEKDPKTVLTGLAGTVLGRLPDVGTTDTGKTHKVRYEVTGPGRASSVTYSDPVKGKSVSLRNVKLPWHAETPFVPYGSQSPTSFNVSAWSKAFPPAGMRCRIIVDGAEVESKAGLGSALCQAFDSR